MTWHGLFFSDVAVGAVAALLVAWWLGRRVGGASAAWLVTWSGVGGLIGAIVFFPALFMSAVWSRSRVPDVPTPRSLFVWSAASIIVLAAGVCGLVARNGYRTGVRR